ncbi:MAG: metal ABC transporter ATP-binding protein [Hyphomicrobiales bacterium]|nr:metal ABC transporter ATP-binding protein [Hyphomicrobiales bacterium]
MTALAPSLMAMPPRAPEIAAAERRMLVSARGVSVELGGRAVLDNVTITVRAGDIVTVIGPNGAGKTTLARVLLGLQPIARGEVARAPGLKVGYVPQRFPVDQAIPLDVRRFVTMSRKAPLAEVREALAETGAEHLLNEALATLSGGELQRVMIARALLREPDLLVLDEPVQAVDYAGEAQLYDLIAAIRDRRGCGVLLISHDLHMVMKSSDRVVCVNRHICCEGGPQTVARDPAYLRLFGLEGLDALGVYRHRHDHTHTLAGDVCVHDRGRDAG